MSLVNIYANALLGAAVDAKASVADLEKIEKQLQDFNGIL